MSIENTNVRDHPELSPIETHFHMESENPKKWPPAMAVDTFIRLVLLGGLLTWCVLILAPFTSILMWSVILAVALYPAFAALARLMGGRPAWAATVMVVVAWPVWPYPAISRAAVWWIR